MKTILLSPSDLAVAAALLVVDAGLFLALRLDLHKDLAVAALRMTIQLLAIGFVLRFLFALANPAATLGVLVVMLLVAARELAVRPQRRLAGLAGYLIGATSIGFATTLTAILALTTAIRPEPWYDPRYALPLVGIILGTALNSGSITLDSVLSDFPDQRAAIEARLALGESFAAASRPLVANAIRRGMIPVLNQMAAAGIVTLPGIMTGQILAGMDPIDAVKYQILLMCLLAGASGLVAVSVAILTARRFTDDRQRLRLDRLR